MVYERYRQEGKTVQRVYYVYPPSGQGISSFSLHSISQFLGKQMKTLSGGPSGVKPTLSPLCSFIIEYDWLVS